MADLAGTDALDEGYRECWKRKSDGLECSTDPLNCNTPFASSSEEERDEFGTRSRSSHMLHITIHPFIIHLAGCYKNLKLYEWISSKSRDQPVSTEDGGMFNHKPGQTCMEHSKNPARAWTRGSR